MPSVDRAVCQRKFGRELGRLTEQQATLRARGIFLVGAPEFPIIELLFVPRHPLRMAFAGAQVGNITPPPGQMVAIDLLNLSARAFKARFDLTDYDLRAPSLEFLDPWTDSLLPYDTMFRALEYEKDRKAHVVLLGDHPNTHKPFLCLRGIREYHEHPQHSGDEWLLYRTEMSLFSVIMSLWRASIYLARPTVVLQSGMIQVQWVAEEKI